MCDNKDMEIEKWKSKCHFMQEENCHLRKTVDEINCRLEKTTTELEEVKTGRKANMLLQVRYDQLLKATKELAQCLQYETGNGFIE